MAQKLTASMPENMDLDGTYTVQWAALDPTTGENVGGVLIGNAAMLVSQVSPGGAGELEGSGFTLEPLFVPLPIPDPPAGS